MKIMLHHDIIDDRRYPSIRQIHKLRFRLTSINLDIIQREVKIAPARIGRTAPTKRIILPAIPKPQLPNITSRKRRYIAPSQRPSHFSLRILVLLPCQRSHARSKVGKFQPHRAPFSPRRILSTLHGNFRRGFEFANVFHSESFVALGSYECLVGRSVAAHAAYQSGKAAGAQVDSLFGIVALSETCRCDGGFSVSVYLSDEESVTEFIRFPLALGEGGDDGSGRIRRRRRIVRAVIIIIVCSIIVVVFVIIIIIRLIIRIEIIRLPIDRAVVDPEQTDIGGSLPKLEQHPLCRLRRPIIGMSHVQIRM
mmetsp:Transcript_2717/g.6070  ORF Transcript_2717/g.6070 Transcript_2717/m.6070 type:complete len:309 (+) Transcript_2717:590-1516(+)